MKQVLSMLAGAADGAMLVDEQGRVVFWNRAAERMLGFRAEAVLGRPCHDVFRGQTLGGHPLCSASCVIGTRVAAGRSVRNFDMQTRTKAGRMVWLNISSLPVPTGRKGRFWAAHLFRDITKQAKVRQLVEELRSAVCSLRSASGAPYQEEPPPIPSSLPLTEREAEVLRLLASGKGTKAIAEALFVSQATVRNHIQHVLEKLGAHTRLEALAIAFPPRSPAS
ncbi:MAG: PAS and helix-turn-helix domain-containing protein [Nitrospirota bacterium]